MNVDWNRLFGFALLLAAFNWPGSESGGVLAQEEAKPEVAKAETPAESDPGKATPPSSPQAEAKNPAPDQKRETPKQTPAPVPSRPPSPPAPSTLFGTTTVAYADLTPFPQWTGALERYYQRRGAVSGACQASAFNSCHMQRWQQMLNEVRSETRQRQLNLVNTYMNTHRYIVDPINWGVNEYWAIPNEFLKKFGDCEDYAIAKYLSLRALGWNPDDMSIVVLQDMNLRVMHAVLIVKFNGANMLLDNQITLVIDSEKVHHYKPIYSLNEKGWWRHSPKRRGAG